MSTTLSNRDQAKKLMKNIEFCERNKYKTVKCNNEKCTFQNNCKFYHTLSDKRNLICVFNLFGCCDIDNCQFDHIGTFENWKQILPKIKVKKYILDEEKEKENQESQVKIDLRVTEQIKSVSISERDDLNHSASEIEDKLSKDDDINIDDKKIVIKKKTWIEIEEEEDENNFTKETLGIEKLRPFRNRKKVEELGVYRLYHNENVTINSTLEQKEIRGIIVNEEKNYIAVKSFPFTDEYDTSSKYFEKALDGKNLVWMEAYEGPQLRMWFDDVNEKWMISTMRKIDADQSSWRTNRSFKSQFESTIIEQTGINFEDFKYYLKKNLIYTFLLTANIECKSVSKQSFSKIFCLGTFNRDNYFEYALKTHLEKDCSIVHPKIITGIDSKLSLLKEIKKLGAKAEQGILGILKLENNPQLPVLTKILSDEFKMFQDISGNTSSIEVRYLEVRRTKLEANFTKYYSTLVNRFEKVEACIKELAQDIMSKFKKYCSYKYTPTQRVETIVLENLYKTTTFFNIKDIYTTLEQLDAKDFWLLIKPFIDQNNSDYQLKDYIQL